MKIAKLPYSRAPWRLITSDGRQVQAPSIVFDHPALGKTVTSNVISGETKTECTEAALALLEKLLNRNTGGQP
jgi:hypothetical protein